MVRRRCGYIFIFQLGFIGISLAPRTGTAKNAVGTDNQYEEPTADPTALKEKIAVDEDGRVPLVVRGAFGRGINFRSADDSFAVLLRGRIQLQLEYTANGSDAELDFIPRRIRLVLGGHVLQRTVSWYVQLGFGPRDLEPDLQVPLRDAFVTWHACRDVNIRVGQMKVPFV